MPEFQFPQPALATQGQYIQDYTTASRTNTAMTAVTMTTTVTGTASASGFGFNTAEQANAAMGRINQLITTVNALVVDATANKQVLNSLIDDLQANNLAK